MPLTGAKIDILHNHENEPAVTDMSRLKGCVVAIGNFDGLHLGHRALIDAARGTAREASKPLVVLTFSPHPRRYFHPDAAPFALIAPIARRRILAQWGVDAVVTLPFDAALAATSAQDFIDRLLVAGLQPQHVVVGADFAFGHKRSGNADMLKAQGAEKGFGVTALAPARDSEGEIYSSTRIRNHLNAGELEEAQQLLGRPWDMESTVVHGDKRGRELGYPTANQVLGDYLRLPFGIYAVRVLIGEDTVWRGGAANLGIRPMFRVETPLMETFIFNYNEDIYGKTLRVRPVRRLRPEMKFSDLEALISQMKQDCLEAEAVLKSATIL